MNFALNYPENVSKLVVVDIAPISYVPEGIRRITNALQKLNVSAIQSRAQADEMLSADISVHLFFSSSYTL